MAAIQRKASEGALVQRRETPPMGRALGHWQFWLLPVVLTAVITFGLIVCTPDRSDPIYSIHR
jgi:hypothetical protein